MVPLPTTSLSSTGGILLDSLLLTSDGLVTVEELTFSHRGSQGDVFPLQDTQVALPEGGMAPFIALAYGGEQQVRRVSLTDGRSFSAPVDQAVRVRGFHGEQHWKRVGDLTDADYVILHLRSGSGSHEFLNTVLTVCGEVTDDEFSDNSTRNPDDVWGRLVLTLPTPELRDRVQSLFLAEGVHFERDEETEGFALVAYHDSFPRLMFGPIDVDDSVLPINLTSLRGVGFDVETDDSTELLSKSSYSPEQLAELRRLVSPAPEESVRTRVEQVEDVGMLPVYQVFTEGAGFIVDGVGMKAIVS